MEEEQTQEEPLKVIIKTEVDAKQYIDARVEQIQEYLSRIDNHLKELKQVTE